MYNTLKKKLERNNVHTLKLLMNLFMHTLKAYSFVFVKIGIEFFLCNYSFNLFEQNIKFSTCFYQINKIFCKLYIYFHT